MADVAKSLDKIDLSPYSITFKGDGLGFVKDVDPSGFKVDNVELKVGELGDIVVDRRVIGASGTIKLVLHQCEIAVFRKVIQGAPGTGAVPLIPTARYASMYAAAGVLCIHPNAVSGTAEDINFVKAAVVNYKLPKMSDGKVYREVEVEFEPFPDQALLTAATPTIVYGYIGPIPS